MDITVVSALMIDCETAITVENKVRVELHSDEIIIGEVAYIDNSFITVESKLLKDIDIYIEDIRNIEIID